MRLAARNLGSNYLAYAAAVASGLVLTPVIIDAVGKEGYGAWIFIASITTVLRLLDFGITPTVVRFTAFHRGRGASEDIDVLASASLAVYLILGLISLIAGLVLAWFLPDLITLSPDLQQPAQVATVIAVLTLGTQAPLGLFGSLLKGAQRFDVLNTGALISIVAYTILVIVILTRHSTLPVLATIAFAASLIRLGYPILFIRRELPGLRISRAAVSRESLKALLGFSWFAFLGHMAGKVVFSADVIVIGMILGAKEVALYGVAARLFGLVAGVASTGTDLLLPLQSELEGREDHARQRSFVTVGVRASACVAVLLGFPLIILPTWVLTAWLGSGFKASVAPLALLGAAAVFTTTNGVLAQYLFARGKPALLALAQAGLAAANLGLTIGLLLATGDIWAAALATLVVEAIGAVVVLPLLARRRGVSLRQLTMAWAKPVLAGLVAALPTLVLARAVTQTSSLVVLACVGAMWAAAFSAVAWRLALTDGERTLVRSLVRGRRGRPSVPMPLHEALRLPREDDRRGLMSYRFGSIDELGEGYGFRKVRSALEVTAFGVNALVYPPGQEGFLHYHDLQDELYFVHSGTARFEVDGEERLLGPGGLCHVTSTTPRKVSNGGEEDLVLLIVGGKDGYVARDGQLVDPEADADRRAALGKS